MYNAGFVRIQWVGETRQDQTRQDSTDMYRSSGGLWWPYLEGEGGVCELYEVAMGWGGKGGLEGDHDHDQKDGIRGGDQWWLGDVCFVGASVR